MGNVVLIPENLMALSTGSVVCGSEASVSMADENLTSEIPSKFWRSLSNAPSDVKMFLSSNTFSDLTADALAIVGHNLKNGDQYRAVYGDFSYLGFVAVNPNITTASTNATGPSTPNLHLDVNEGEALGTDWVVPSVTATNWDVSFGFASPLGTPTVGADLQAFWIYVKVNSAPDFIYNAPVVTAYLYENGVLRSTLGSKYVTVASGQWMFFPWDISTYTAADIEIKLEFTSPSIYYASLNSVFWAAEYPAAQGGTNIDGAWHTYNPFVGTLLYSPESRGASDTILIQFGSALVFKCVTVYFRSDHAPTSFNPQYSSPINPQGYVQVGAVALGETLVTTVNMSYGKLVAGIDTSPRKRTYGGQLFGSRRPVRRVVSLQLGHLTPAECHTLFDRLIWRHGVMKPILISLLPDDATQSKHTTIFGALRNPENWVNIQPDEGYENNMSLEFEEVL